MKVVQETNIFIWKLSNSKKLEEPHIMKSLSSIDNLDNTGTNYSVLKVNVNPLIQTQSLYVPHIKKLLPQSNSEASILKEVLSLFSCKWFGKDIFLGFNSKGGLASVNHLHYHVSSKRAGCGEIFAEKTIEEGEVLGETEIYKVMKVKHLYCYALRIEMKRLLD